MPEILSKLGLELNNLPDGTFDLLPYSGVLRISGGRPKIAVADFLPPVEILEKEIKCNLTYEELPQDYVDPADKDREGENRLFVLAENDAIVTIKLAAISHEDKILSMKPVFRSDRDDSAYVDGSLLFKHLWDLLINDDIAELQFMITVVVSQASCPGYPVVYENDLARKLGENERTGNRREYVARELTTGYRRYISLLLFISSAAANEAKHLNNRPVPDVLNKVWNAASCSVVHLGDASPNSELHSTREDAWRLLCTFHSVETASKNVNRKLSHDSEDFVLCLDSFMDSLVGNKLGAGEGSTAIQILNYLFEEKGINLEIALRKTLEYYVYEAIPCMPGNAARKLSKRPAAPVA